MSNVNFVLQGKGGVGKSMIAALLAQHYRSGGREPLCIDTDPNNKTLVGYKAFDVTSLEIMEDNNINPRGFDQLVEMILNADEETPVVVDNGASSFIPLVAYLVESDVLSLIKDHGKDVTLHSVVTGGQAFHDTIVGLVNLFSAFPDTDTCVWANEFWGKPQMNGQAFEETRVVKDNEAQIHALFTIPRMKEGTFGLDMDQMLKSKMTFDEVSRDPAYTIMAKHRLNQVWKNLNGQMTQAHL